MLFRSHMHRDPGEQHDTYDNGAATYVDLDTYNIELRDSRLNPNTWYQYLSTTDTLPEPFVDSVAPDRYECIPVTSPSFVQKRVYRPREGGMVVVENGPRIPRPHRLSFRTGTYTNYDDTDDEEEDRIWNAMTRRNKLLGAALAWLTVLHHQAWTRPNAEPMLPFDVV